jgi:hypothetical protein
MKKLLLLIAGSLLLSACSGGAGSNSGPASSTGSSGKGIEIKLKDKTYTLEEKSGYLFSNDTTINFPDKSVKTANRDFVVANYDVDAGFGMFSTGKKMTAPDQVRIIIKLEDKADTNKDAPISLGEYNSKQEEFMKFFNVFIYTFADGKDAENKILGGYDNTKGGVKITAVNGDDITGEIDVTNGENTVKGSFKAKVWKNK